MAALPELEAQTEEDRPRRRAWDWLARVQATVDRLDRHLVGHDELLRDMLNVHLAQVSVRQNEDMRKISAWAAMITVPTLIAGIYGMNFRHMPELTWPVGYPLAILLMAGVCWLLYRAFRRSGWL
jgi:magnesium transporter